MALLSIIIIVIIANQLNCEKFIVDSNTYYMINNKFQMKYELKNLHNY